MNRSESINELAAALAKAQSKMKHAGKDATNPHFKSKYATLASVVDSVREQLTANGIAFVQLPQDCDNGVAVETTLLHSSGQWISSVTRVPVNKQDAHGVGSALTYAKRYGLAAMCGIAADDDDDGNAAVEAPRRNPPVRQAVLEESGRPPESVNAYFDPLVEAVINDDVTGLVQLKAELDAMGENAYIAVYDQMTPPKRARADWLLRQYQAGERGVADVASAYRDAKGR